MLAEKVMKLQRLKQKLFPTQWSHQILLSGGLNSTGFQRFGLLSSSGLVWFPVSFTCPSTSTLLFLLSSLLTRSTTTLCLLLPACPVCSALWKMGPSADFLRMCAVEMAFTLLTHLENKTHLQLSKFWEENVQVVKFLRTEVSSEWCFGEET